MINGQVSDEWFEPVSDSWVKGSYSQWLHYSTLAVKRGPRPRNLKYDDPERESGRSLRPGACGLRHGLSAAVGLASRGARGARLPRRVCAERLLGGATCPTLLV